VVAERGKHGDAFDLLKSNAILPPPSTLPSSPPPTHFHPSTSHTTHSSGVDIFIAGHDHAYERSAPVYNYRVDEECGTVYLVTGFNGDEVNYGWMDQWPFFTANPDLLKYGGTVPNFGNRKGVVIGRDISINAAEDGAGAKSLWCFRREQRIRVFSMVETKAGNSLATSGIA
jgi:hypothetical protein